MIVNDEAAKARLNSPMNLINKLRQASSPRNSAMNLFCGPKNKKIEEVKISFNPFEVPKHISSQPQTPSSIPAISSSEHQPVLGDILENHESQIKLGLAHDKALDLLNRSVALLSDKLDDIRADKLPTVMSAAGKVVESIRKERNEASKNQKDREVHYHFYTPQQNKLSDYEVIDVG